MIISQYPRYYKQKKIILVNDLKIFYPLKFFLHFAFRWITIHRSDCHWLTKSPIRFSLADKPICVPDQKRIYGVARHEDAHVICRVEAYPPPESFRWTFNNTEEMVDVPQARYKNSTRHTQSVLIYRPVSEMDYGTVLCWASNTAGQQKNACIFHIIPAGMYARSDARSLWIAKDFREKFRRNVLRNAHTQRFATLCRNNIVFVAKSVFRK